MVLTPLFRGALLAVGAPLLIAAPALSATLVGEATVGETAVREIYTLSRDWAGRSSGSDRERQTGDYLYGRLQSFGFAPQRQSFSYLLNGQTYQSSNIIAERRGTSGQQIIIGAHYDTMPSEAHLDRSTLQGTNDNAAGVGVLLELAQRLEAQTYHTVKFILFGSEEVGLKGSRHYMNSMSENEINNTLVMVNLDSLIFGDKMYFHAGKAAAYRPEWGKYRDLALAIAARQGIVAETNPGLNPFFPQGTGCCSDQMIFEWLVPVLAAEATNWELGRKDGYTQTRNPLVPGGKTWHDPRTDSVEFLEQNFPGLIQQRSRNYTSILDAFIDELNISSNPKTEIAYQPIPEPATLMGTVTGAIALGFLIKNRHR